MIVILIVTVLMGPIGIYVGLLIVAKNLGKRTLSDRARFIHQSLVQQWNVTASQRLRKRIVVFLKSFPTDIIDRMIQIRRAEEEAASRRLVRIYGHVFHTALFNQNFRPVGLKVVKPTKLSKGIMYRRSQYAAKGDVPKTANVYVGQHAD